MKKKFRSLLSLFTLFTFIFLNIPIAVKVKAETTSEKQRVNFALGGSATASNTEAGQENVWGPDKTIDGIVNRDAAKANQSRWATDMGTVERVLTVDLKEEKTFDEFNIEWERANIKNFSIKVSNNNSDFTEVYNKSDNTNITDLKTNIKLNNTVSGRYVKLSIYGYDGGVLNWPSVSLYEFEIIGDLVEEDEEVDPTTNIALNKPATASSIEASTLTPNKAVDGAKGKSSRWASAVRSNEEWLRVDLGKKSQIKTVVIDWERRNATNYEIQISDNDSTWTTVKSINSHPKYVNDKIVLDNTVEGRYIRLLIKSHALSDQVSGGVEWNNVSVEEFSVYPGIIEDTIQDVVKTITVPTIGANDEKLIMPTVPDGFDIKFVGADYEQIIGRDLTIYKPIVNTKVTVTFEVSKGNEKAFTDSIEVNVPGKYTSEPDANVKPVVIPEIREWLGLSGNFEVNDSSRIVIDPAYKNELSKMANTFAEDYKDIVNKEISVVESTDSKAGDFYFTLNTEDEGLGKEGHLMTISDFIKIEAKDSTGAFWATRSILQILKQNKTIIPQGIVRDYPKYEVRGFMLDVGRKPFSLEYLYETAKTMSWYKMNDFQVHLNDNYIFLEDYSNSGQDPMNAYSGFRLESDIKAGGNNGLNKADLTSTDTFYTKAEFRNFIQDSREIGVNIVPEFDTPAHSLPFTKVRPDLKMGNVGRQADHLDVTKSGTLEFVKGLWDEYLDGENPVFDSETVVNIGTDEYDAKYTEQFRKFTDDLLGYIQDEKDRTVRLWGSLTARPGTTPVRSENVQMNIWNSGWANPNEMFKSGYDLINMIDGTLYIVPGAGYYYDYLNKSYLYNNWQPNAMGGTPIPAGHEQMLGSAFAVWNDMIDKKDNGMIEYDIYDRFIDALPAYSSKLWGDGKDLTFNQLEAKADEIGEAPNTNMTNKVDTKTNDVLNLGLDDDKDASGNGYDIVAKANSSIEKVDGRNALKLNGNESYAETELNDIGMGSVLQFKVKKNAGDNSEQILFESEEGAVKAVQVGTGNVGFSRAGRDYSFNYKLPDNEWVELAIKNVKDQTSLYVNGNLVQTIGETANGAGKIHATFNLPLTRIGSQTKAFNGYVDDVRVIKGNVQLSTLSLVGAIAETSDLVKEEYTVESWTALESRILEAKAVLIKLNATVEEIENAKNNINSAIEALEEAETPVEVDKTMLTVAIEYAEAEKEKEEFGNVVPLVRAKFEEALSEAKTVLANENATQAQVDVASNKLINLIHMLGFTKGDKTELIKLVEIINALDESKYTTSTWSALQIELEKANAVIADENAMEEEVAKTYESLNKAFVDLELTADKVKLRELVAEFEIVDLSKYTIGSVNKFNSELVNAKDVLNNNEATQEQVNEAYNSLIKAYLDLRLIPDKAKLQELINKAEAIDTSKYTTESVKAFNLHLNEVKVILNNEEATQEEVDDAVVVLERAIDNLKLKTEQPSPKPEEPKDTNKPQTREQSSNLPETGGNNPMIGILIALLLLGGGAFFIFNKKKASSDEK